MRRRKRRKRSAPPIFKKAKKLKSQRTGLPLGLLAWTLLGSIHREEDAVEATKCRLPIKPGQKRILNVPDPVPDHALGDDTTIEKNYKDGISELRGRAVQVLEQAPDYLISAWRIAPSWIVPESWLGDPCSKWAVGDLVVVNVPEDPSKDWPHAAADSLWAVEVSSRRGLLCKIKTLHMGGAHEQDPVCTVEGCDYSIPLRWLSEPERSATPWAECRACDGTGTNSKGHSCRICDAQGQSLLRVGQDRDALIETIRRLTEEKDAARAAEHGAAKLRDQAIRDRDADREQWQRERDQFAEINKKLTISLEVSKHDYEQKELQLREISCDYANKWALACQEWYMLAKAAEDREPENYSFTDEIKDAYANDYVAACLLILALAVLLFPLVLVEMGAKRAVRYVLSKANPRRYWASIKKCFKLVMHVMIWGSVVTAALVVLLGVGMAGDRLLTFPSERRDSTPTVAPVSTTTRPKWL